MNWVLKICAKKVLARLPIPYRFWKPMGISEFGHMDDLDYSLKIFEVHATRSFLNGLQQDPHVLELGPGDSVASAVITKPNGSACSYLVDSSDFATKNLSQYKLPASRITEYAMPLPNLSKVSTFEKKLYYCNSVNMTDGLSSLNLYPLQA